MKALRAAWLVCAALALAPRVAPAVNGDTTPVPPPDKQTQKVLDAMRDSSTEGHPDLDGQFKGILHYEKGDFTEAMKHFLVGARYADKVSQLSIGLLYLNGQGVAKDPVTACAWIALSAERNYPQFVATRDRVCSSLDAQQHEQANAMLAQLAVVYGDAVAKPRMVAQFQQAKLQMTGSHTGFEGDLVVETLGQFAGNLTGSSWRAAGLDSGEPQPRCGLGAVEGGLITGCGDFWASDRWNAREYFKDTDRLWRGTVKVGPLQNVSRDPAPATPPSTGAQQGNPQP
jgi:uncharacterized protein